MRPCVRARASKRLNQAGTNKYIVPRVSAAEIAGFDISIFAWNARGTAPRGKLAARDTSSGYRAPPRVVSRLRNAPEGNLSREGRIKISKIARSHLPFDRNNRLAWIRANGELSVDFPKDRCRGILSNVCGNAPITREPKIRELPGFSGVAKTKWSRWQRLSKSF